MGSSSAALPQMSLPSNLVLGELDMTILRTWRATRGNGQQVQLLQATHALLRRTRLVLFARLDYVQGSTVQSKHQ